MTSFVYFIRNIYSKFSVCLLDFLLYVHGKHLKSCRDCHFLIIIIIIIKTLFKRRPSWMFIQSSLGSSFEACTIIYNIHSITQEKVQLHCNIH